MTKAAELADFTYSTQDVLAERAHKVYQYLDTLDESDTEMAGLLAGDLLENGKPLANTVVIIPVAAHQEAANIEPALAEYAKQVPYEPFSIVLGLNDPANEESPRPREASFAAIERARSAHPGLDIRTCYTGYEEPVIGEVRRDIWNAVAIASRQTGNFKAGPEVIGINHDIDLVSLVPGYIAIIQKVYARRDARHIVAAVSPVMGSLTSHAYSPQHPNISNAVRWSDYVYLKSGYAFEAGLIFPMSHYAEYGGFDRTAITHEAGSLGDKGTPKPRLLVGTGNETSPRRYIARMGDNGYDIWSSDSFTATDDCREYSDYPDISRERQLEVVRGSMPMYASMLIRKASRDAGKHFMDENWHLEIEKSVGAEEIATGLRKYTDRHIAQMATVGGAVLKSLIGSSEMDDLLEKAFSKQLAKAI